MTSTYSIEHLPTSHDTLTVPRQLSTSTNVDVRKNQSEWMDDSNTANIDTLFRNDSRKDRIIIFDILPETDSYQASAYIDIYSEPIKSKNLNLHNPKIIDNRLEEISKELRSLVESEYDWEGYGLKKPKQSTLLKAESFISSFLNLLDKASYVWVEPFIYSDEDGCICTGWYNGSKSLYIHIGSNSLTYRKKLTSVDDMQSEEGNLDGENCISIWKWLINDE